MSLPNNRRRDPGGASSEAVLVWVAIVLVVVVVGAVYAAMHLGHRLAGTGADLPGDPFSVLFGLLGGDLLWPGAAGWWVIAAAAALLVSACNTIEGAGRDVSSVGKAVSSTARDVKR